MSVKPKHAACACGCGEMADECMSGGGALLAAFSVVSGVGSQPVDLKRKQANWLDARSALAFQPNEFNRTWEKHAREALGECVCGKPGTHVFADDATDEWACRIPASALKPEVRV